MKYEDLEPRRAPELGSIRYTQQFVLSDCRVAECIEGNIHVDDGEYVTCYKCRECNRSTVACGIYYGPVTYRTDEDMEKRLAERKEINFNRAGRYHSAKSLVKTIGRSLEEKHDKTDDEDPF